LVTLYLAQFGTAFQFNFKIIGWGLLNGGINWPIYKKGGGARTLPRLISNGAFLDLVKRGNFPTGVQLNLGTEFNLGSKGI